MLGTGAIQQCYSRFVEELTRALDWPTRRSGHGHDSKGLEWTCGSALQKLPPEVSEAMSKIDVMLSSGRAIALPICQPSGKWHSRGSRVVQVPLVDHGGKPVFEDKDRTSTAAEAHRG